MEPYCNVPTMNRSILNHTVTSLCSVVVHTSTPPRAMQRGHYLGEVSSFAVATKCESGVGIQTRSRKGRDLFCTFYHSSHLRRRAVIHKYTCAPLEQSLHCCCLDSLSSKTTRSNMGVVLGAGGTAIGIVKSPRPGIKAELCWVQFTV